MNTGLCLARLNEIHLLFKIGPILSQPKWLCDELSVTGLGRIRTQIIEMKINMDFCYAKQVIASVN